MTETNLEPLILDMLEWLSARERSYDQVMDAWRTSCPRLTIWEDANERGLVATEVRDGRCIVELTPSGLALLRTRGVTEQGKP
jgi:hypothetical protein